MRDIEKEKDMLKNTVREYGIRELQNDEYFEYLLNKR